MRNYVPVWLHSTEETSFSLGPRFEGHLFSQSWLAMRNSIPAWLHSKEETSFRLGASLKGIYSVKIVLP